MDEKLDVLNREDFITKLISVVELLSENKKGCCFGIDGAWGSGKSFVLEKFENRIKDIQLEQTADNKYFVFHYDCWKYDYYDEPAIAIIAAMLDATDNELNVLTAGARDVIKKAAWETTKETLKTVASELCKNKIGIDLVEIATNTVDSTLEEEDSDFDKLYGFKRALEETRAGIRKIADNKTVVIVVDELDRCLPTYSIKVLERLHHIFNELQNVIVIVSMDKKQLEHSIREIYGEIDVDVYLRKFISFKINLAKGKATNYLTKYEAYTSLFDCKNYEDEIETFFAKILQGLDMRTQERIFGKAEIIHNIIKNDNAMDCSIMTFEILFLTLALRTESNYLEWFGSTGLHTAVKEKLGATYYAVIDEYRKIGDGQVTVNGRTYNMVSGLSGKTCLWLASIYHEYNRGICGRYYSNEPYTATREFIKQFAELINIIDSD